MDYVFTPYWGASRIVSEDPTQICEFFGFLHILSFCFVDGPDLAAYVPLAFPESIFEMVGAV